MDTPQKSRKWDSHSNENFLFLTTSILPSDGWSRYSSGLVAELGKVYPIRVLTNDQSGVSKLPAPNFSLRNFLQILKAIWSEVHHKQIVHVLVEPYAFPVAIVCFLKGARLCITLHGTYSRIGFSSPYRSAQMLLSLVIAKSATSGSHEVIKGIPTKSLRGKIRFIPNGVDLDLFYPSAPSAELLAITKASNYFVCVGEIKHRKGQDLAIRAFAKVQDKSTLLIFAGRYSKEAKFQLRRICEDLELNDRVLFLGFVNQALLRELYSNAISTVLFSRQSNNSTEGFPMVIYEANACGTPIIISSGFGSDYAVTDGKNGFLVPQQDVESASIAFQQALGIFLNFSLKDQMNKKCRQEALNHTWHKIISEYLELYGIGTPNED